MRLAQHPKDVRFKAIETHESEGNAPCIEVSYGHLKGEYYEDCFNAVYSFISDVDVPVNAELKLRDLSE